jgi:hypothetical protein
MNSSKWKKVLAIIVFVPLAFALFGWVFMLLWNWLMPELFGLKEITFWQGFGLLILSKIIFGRTSFKWNDNKSRWKMEQKFASMNDEEKERFKQEMRERCKHWGSGC